MWGVILESKIALQHENEVMSTPYQPILNPTLTLIILWANMAMRLPQLAFCILSCVLSCAQHIPLRMYPVQQVDG